MAESSTESALSTPSQSQSSQPSSLSSSTSQPWVICSLHLSLKTAHFSTFYMASFRLSVYYSHMCRMDNGPSLISSITLPPSSPSPSFSDSTPGGGSLLNGPHSYTQSSESLKVKNLSSSLAPILYRTLVELKIVTSSKLNLTWSFIQFSVVSQHIPATGSRAAEFSEGDGWESSAGIRPGWRDCQPASNRQRSEVAKCCFHSNLLENYLLIHVSCKPSRTT